MAAAIRYRIKLRLNMALHGGDPVAVGFFSPQAKPIVFSAILSGGGGMGPNL